MLRLTQVGDTIVEVMIALAILGSAFGISYATANRALTQARNAEEHSQALEYIGKQLELLRLASGNSDAVTAGVFAPLPRAFCLEATSPVTVKDITATTGWNPFNHTADNDDFSRYPSECAESSSLYYLSSTYNLATSVFQVMVRWDGTGSLGRQQEIISYKLHP